MYTRNLHRAMSGFMPLLLICVVSSVAGGAAHERVEELSFETGRVAIHDSPDGARVEYPGAHRGFGEPGTPDLPTRIVQLEIPAATTIGSVRFEILASEPVAASIRVQPVATDHLGNQAAPPLQADAEVYARDRAYPAEQVSFIGRGAMRGHTIATLHVKPWIYNPQRGTLELVTRLRVSLELEPAPAIAIERHRIDPKIEARFERDATHLLTGDLESLAGAAGHLVGDGPAGPGPYQPTFRPTTDGSAVEYVIVTSEALRPQFERLASWKTRKGVQGVVRTLEWIDQTYPNGVDRAERVRFFIRDAYQNWSTLWVLLGGDTDVVPLRYGENTLLGGETIPVDYYFSCLDGNWNSDGDDRFGEGWASQTELGDGVDLMPEVFVGRAPVSTLQEASDFIDKTLAYDIESATGNGYPASALFVVERLFTSYHGAEVSEAAVATLQTHAPWWKIVRLYEEPENWPGSLELSREAAIDSVNNGFGVVHHVGHGARNTMSVGDETLTNADADNFENGPRQSVVFAINCSSASIDFNSIGERWVKNPDGGSITYYGTSRFAFVNASREVQQEWYSLVFEDSVRALGAACTYARLPLVASADFDNAFRWTVFALTLLGDPEVDIYSQRPEPIQATHPSTFELGSGTFSLSADVDGSALSGATVTAWMEGDFYELAETDGSGNATLALPAASAGVCSVTIHGGSHLPYQGVVTLNDATGPYAVIETVAIIDDGSGASAGDGDGLADAGETVELTVTVRNAGAAGWSGAGGVITVDDPGGYMTLAGDAVSYGSVGAGGLSTGAGNFVVEIDPVAPEALQPVFTLTLTANEGTWTDVFVLPVHRAFVEHYDHTVDDAVPRGNGNGEVESGENIWYTIDARNSGLETAFDVDATLRALRKSDFQPEPLVTLNDDQMSFGNIAVGQVETGDRFDFTLDGGLDPATIVLEVSYTDIYGQAWAETLDVVRPGVVDSLRAFGSTTSIYLKWRAPEDEDLLGYDIYRADDEIGPFSRINVFTGEGSSLFEDSSLQPLTRYFYQVVARDSSMNQGAPSSIFSGSTTPPLSLGWPIGVGQQVQSSLQVADVDGDWRYEIFTAADFQYGWHADGTEIVDGDNDPRTSGVLSSWGYNPSKGYGATTALGDVDQDGDVEICNVAWSVTQIYLWDNMGEMMPGWPKEMLDDFNWASPALVDLDLDGDLEVVVWAAKGGRLFAWHHDGVEVADGDNNPATDGVLRRIFGVSFNYTSPGIANLDADPEPEIVICTNLSSSPTDPQGAIYVINNDGSDVPGWPVETGDETHTSQITASPAIVDLDGDGENEIVVPSERDGGLMHVFRNDGTDFPGWPVAVPSFSPQVRVGSPSIADIDGDQQLDIVYPDTDGELWVWDRNGTVLSGFPVVYMTGIHDQATQSTASIGDVDGDGMMEMFFGDENGFLHGFNHDGSPVNGFPILLGGEVRSTPLIWDIDNDNLIEIAVSCWDSSVYIWDMPDQWNPDLIPWPMFRHDAQNTGYVENDILPVAVADPGPAGAAPIVARVLPPYPNPFNPWTRLLFDVPAGGVQRVDIAIFDVHGRLIRRLADGLFEPGRHEAIWDGRSIHGGPATTGIYFYRADIGSYSQTGKLTLLK